ncbi:MAG: FHA domain-containing protein [Atopobiaceae bacterium]|nr:FHA domain-containing protein [Atopobiaceae bacterium]
MFNQTPGSYMYDELRKTAHLSNRDAAQILLSERPIFAGRSPRSRISERTFLSRDVVHVQPDNINPALFADFSQSAQTITSRLVAACGGGEAAYARIVGRYSGEVAQQMSSILNAYGRDGRIYTNMVMRLRSVSLRRQNDRAVLLVMAFIAVGCLADPHAASAAVERFTQQHLASSLGTVISGGPKRGGTVIGLEATDQLGLVRVVNGAVRPPIHPLSLDPSGTVIGSLPVASSAITDVEVDVSRQHLVVWCQGGSWWARGMKSTNGTYLISGSTQEIVPIELPRAVRGEAPSAPVEIHPGDTLCLGRYTRFLVMSVRG